ncbi:hypothetical protein ABKV19_001839 [Rosa sericea]
MIKTATAAFLALLTSFTAFLLFSPTPKSSYHSLFISDSLSSNTSISRHLHTLTRRPHVAGTPANAEAAAYVLSIFTSSNLQSRITPYHVALTYPISRSLTLTLTPSPPISFDLQQETYPGDPYADVAAEVLPTFHAFAKSGDVTGHVVYVNYGRVEDYETLKKMGVNVSGTIVLARYGEIYRGSIVQIAYEQGAVGALVYTDRKDYGGGGGGRWFPEEKWLPPSGVQVGTVYNGIGDPTTPGWASSEECERLSDEEVEKGGDLTLIPSLPISGADGETILRAIGGQVANDDWQGSGDAPTYRVGPGPGVVHLSYTGKQVIEKIENVIGVIEGEEEPDRFVILGNHRDAWTFGAVDPNSGTAALLEIAQKLGKLQEKGWKPRRTIILCNWDAEEYGLYMRQDSGPLPLHSLMNFLSKLLNRSKILITHHKLSTKHGLVPAVLLQLAGWEVENLILQLLFNILEFRQLTWLSVKDTQYTIPCMMTLYGWKNLVILSFIGMLQWQVYGV